MGSSWVHHNYNSLALLYHNNPLAVQPTFNHTLTPQRRRLYRAYQKSEQQLSLQHPPLITLLHQQVKLINKHRHSVRITKKQLIQLSKYLLQRFLMKFVVTKILLLDFVLLFMNFNHFLHQQNVINSYKCFCFLFLVYFIFDSFISKSWFELCNCTKISGCSNIYSGFISSARTSNTSHSIFSIHKCICSTNRNLSNKSKDINIRFNYILNHFRNQNVI